MLCDQASPLSVREVWKDPKNPKGLPETGNSIKKVGSALKQSVKDWGKELADPTKWFSSGTEIARVYVYDGFWFTSLGRTISAEGDRIVQANATAVYTRYYRAL